MDDVKRYQPGEFAKIVGMTKRALRHYHEIGILKPAFTSELGHHFYTEDNFFEAQRILSLRFIGFSLEEIAEMQISGSDIPKSLRMQRSLLEEKIAQLRLIADTIEEMEQTAGQPGGIAWEEIFGAVKYAKYRMTHEKMMAYYDERAGEYEDIFVGKGPASFKPDYYAEDIGRMEGYLSRFGQGHIIDIACGSGYWLKYYYPNGSRFTFLDQSGRMLEACREKAAGLGIEPQSLFIQDDILEHEFGRRERYDSAVVGFLLSHFTRRQEEAFFHRLRGILRPGARLLIVDSTWSRERARTQNKEDIEERCLNDGRRFTIYKRYFDKEDLPAMLARYGITVKEYYFGKTFVLITGEW